MIKNASPDTLCDPADIVSDLKIKGLSIADDGSKNGGKDDLKEKLMMMKSSKVFVACISDEYVLNEQCRMEFQYAKATLKKPVVPLVIGDGMEWMMSVVGMFYFAGLEFQLGCHGGRVTIACHGVGFNWGVMG